MFIAALLFSMSAQATLIDFTDKSWQDAINSGAGTLATIGNVTLTASGGDFSFNGGYSERSGCNNSAGGSLLKCNGDGIGISDDEIRQGGNQKITVSFTDGPVNIENIYFLDLFANDNGTDNDEIAVMSIGSNNYTYTAVSDLVGGFYNTGFSEQGISSIMFSGNLDGFSDYALAGIEISPVPLPGAAILFGSALLGFFGFKRRRAV